MNKDEEAFRKSFYDEETASQQIDRLSYKYSFQKVSEFEEDSGSGRISMLVQGEVLINNEVKEVYNTYYFKQNKQGVWKLGLIE